MDWLIEITALLSYLHFGLQGGKLCSGQELHTAVCFLLYIMCYNGNYLKKKCSRQSFSLLSCLLRRKWEATLNKVICLSFIICVTIKQLKILNKGLYRNCFPISLMNKEQLSNKIIYQEPMIGEQLGSPQIKASFNYAFR